MNFFKNIVKGAIFGMINKKSRYIFLLMMLAPLCALAQDPTFSQYYASSLYLNPAFAGVESKITLASNYRNQWSSIVSPYVASQASLIFPIKKKKLNDKHLGGIGFSVNNNKSGQGSYQTLGASLNIGYNVHLSSQSYLTFGAQGGFVQKSINTSAYQWGSQFDRNLGDYDPSKPVDLSLINNNTSFSDFAGGIMYYYNPQRDYDIHGFSFYSGVAAYHLSQPNESMFKDHAQTLPMLMKAHMGCEWNVSPKFNFSPNVLLAMQQGQRQVNTGAYLTFLFGSDEPGFAPGFLLLGSWYRFKDSFIFSTGVGNSNYTIGLSYDLNKSSLRYNARGTGAYEISLKIQVGTSTKRVRIYNPLI